MSLNLELATYFLRSSWIKLQQQKYKFKIFKKLFLFYLLKSFMNSSLLNLALIKILPTYFQTMKLKKNTARCFLQIDSSLLLSSIFYKHSYHSPYDPDISCLKKKSLLSPFVFYCLVRKHVSPYNFENLDLLGLKCRYTGSTNGHTIADS